METNDERVCDLVDNGKAVIFDFSGVYAEFDRRVREWELTVDLVALAKAEESARKFLAELRLCAVVQLIQWIFQEEPQILDEKLLIRCRAAAG